jgi:MFS family permease
VRDVRVVWRHAYYRRLLATNLTSRLGDGFLLASAGTYLLFDPREAATLSDFAIASIALYLPYSLIGPFAGVVLDRWPRRQVLFGASMLRAVSATGLAAVVAAGAPLPVFAVVLLVTVGLNRFFIAGVGASIPRVVPLDELVMANAVTPTLGTLTFTAGGLAAVAVRGAAGGSGTGDAAIMVVAAVCFAAAALLMLRIPRAQLGPETTDGLPAVSSAVALVVAGLVGAIGHLRERVPAGWALLVMATHRFAFGFVVAQTVVLFRNYFFDPDEVDEALGAVAASGLAIGLGIGISVLLTPVATRRMRKERWMVGLLALGAVTILLPAAVLQVWAVMVAAVFLGLSTQGVKICVDSLVQQWADDEYRGRAFSIYDMLYNVALASSAIVAALVLPPDGVAALGFVGVAVLIAATAVLYGRATSSTLYRSQRIGSPAKP